MKEGNRWFLGRHWLVIFAVGALVFLSLSLLWGYLSWQNNQRDIATAEKVDEFKFLSGNVEFFSEQVITGNARAIAPLADTVEKMDDAVNLLLQVEESAEATMIESYESLVNFWRSIRSNTTIISEIEPSIVLIDSISSRLKNTSIQAQKIAISATELAIAKGASKEQIDTLNRQALLLRSMADNMSDFAEQESANNGFFDDYRANFVEFDSNHRALLDGDVSRNINALKDGRLRTDINDINSLLDGMREADTNIVNAVDALATVREAHVKKTSSFEGLDVVFSNLDKGYADIKTSRFPQPVHVIIALIMAMLCVIGFITARRQSARTVMEADQVENENVQAAILRLLDELADLADGDLTVTTTVSENFTGAIADSVNYTIDQLRQLVSRINITAVRVSSAAQDSQQTALQLAEASDHQAQEIAGASAAINEMAVTIDQVSANAAESALVASKSVSIANNGAKLVQNTIHGMDTIREQIQDTSKRIKRLGESSQEIGDIVSLINDIADQTNILALNAAIQASMAGDAGRGFAVVADEVQRLAERSAGATKQIESLVKTIQSDTNEAVTSMEQTTAEVVSGARLAQDAGVALEEIEVVSANIAELIQNISNAARQQASSAGHISNTMNVIQEITSQTSAGTGATAQSIGDLADMALELRESVAGFTLPEIMEEEIEMDRDAWLSSVAPAVSESISVHPEAIDPLEGLIPTVTSLDADDDLDLDAIINAQGIDADNDDFTQLFDSNTDFDDNDFAVGGDELGLSGSGSGSKPGNSDASRALAAGEYYFSEDDISTLFDSDDSSSDASDIDLSDFDFSEETGTDKKDQAK